MGLWLMFAHAEGGSWTNKAGHVLSAVPVALEGTQVQFTNQTQTFTYPLSVFTDSEQARLKAVFGCVEIPGELSAAYASEQRLLKRLNILHAAGKISDQEYKEQRERARRSFREDADSKKTRLHMESRE